MVALTCTVEKATSADEVNTAFREAAKTGPLKGVLAVSEEPLVSVDYIGSLQSSTVDALSPTWSTARWSTSLAGTTTRWATRRGAWTCCGTSGQRL